MSESALTNQAEGDLFDIFLFGYEQFGARQAEIYAANWSTPFNRWRTIPASAAKRS
jgi:plasmid stabilization system protein ParE